MIFRVSNAGKVGAPSTKWCRVGEAVMTKTAFLIRFCKLNKMLMLQDINFRLAWGSAQNALTVNAFLASSASFAACFTMPKLPRKQEDVELCSITNPFRQWKARSKGLRSLNGEECFRVG